MKYFFHSLMFFLIAGIALALTFALKPNFIEETSGLFSSHKNGMKSFRNKYPDYFISKNKIELENGIDVKLILEKIKNKYSRQPINTEDGLKIEFDSDWVHLRTSNTEPIIRIYAESNFETTADNIAKRLMQDIGQMMWTG